MSDAGPAITRFAFERGELRGTHLTLYPTCLIHRSDSHLETMPLAGVTAVSVAFERNPRQLGWGIVLVAISLILLAVAGPLGNFASTALAAGQQPIPAMQTLYRLLEALASLLPVAALACVISGGALGAFGWLGKTTLVVSLPGSERVYRTGSRNTMLMDFAEALSERLMLLKR